MDTRVDDRFIQGLLDIKTGRFEKWGEELVWVNHGQPRAPGPPMQES